MGRSASSFGEVMAARKERQKNFHTQNKMSVVWNLQVGAEAGGQQGTTLRSPVGTPGELTFLDESS